MDRRSCALILDDSALFRGYLRTVLTRYCPVKEIREAGTAQEAMREIRETLPDIAMVDVLLGGISGFQIGRTLKQIHPTLKIIFLSAIDTTEYQEEARRLDSYFVAKGDILEDLPPLLEELSVPQPRRSGIR